MKGYFKNIAKDTNLQMFITPHVYDTKIELFFF